MSLLLELSAKDGAFVRGQAPERPAPAPAKPGNAGSGDVRKKQIPVIKPPAGPSATEWEGGSYVSMQEWLEGGKGNSAILLQPADDVRALDGRLDGAPLIAVDFHRIGDGRGYTHAFLLRKRLGYAGPLRALGAVTADQVYAMARVGFDSFALRADQSADTALAALKTFSVPYQGAVVAGTLADREAALVDAKVRLLERALKNIALEHDRPALSSSLSAEDMVIADVIARLNLPIDVFTLDTGRLHQETLDLIGETKARYGLQIDVVKPDAGAVSDYVATHGADAFYESVELRKLCCNIRKVAPLNQALEGRDAWVTGQRREQAVTRGALPESERDTDRDMQKYNPLADWSWTDVLAYANRFNIPMSALYKRGYVSIGCEPCTKAVRPGEDPREGRWWWENKDSKECGLHSINVPGAVTATRAA
jgi:phosphoadenosine phosphosulfate reductase